MPRGTLNDLDKDMMGRALALARRGEGRVEPNPMVGCVIARGQRILGEGFHRRFGGPHAEIVALSACGRSIAGATVYVSLEPCCHWGKTPPCTEALIRAKAGRVVVPFCDPNPHVGGAGLRQLRAAGIEVTTSVLQEEAAEVLAPFLTRQRGGRPYVIAKWAQSLDGKLATQSGDSHWISGEAARRMVHQLRARVDAILVGSGTVLADDPMLTARGVPIRRVARRVVLDGRLRIRERCRLVRTAGQTPTIVITDPLKAAQPKLNRLSWRYGVQPLAVSPRHRSLGLRGILKILAERDVTNLLVEGGPTVLSSFFEEGVVDEAWVFVAAKFFGGTLAPSVLGNRGIRLISDATTPRRVLIRRVGDDVLVRLFLSNPHRFTDPERRIQAAGF